MNPDPAEGREPWTVTPDRVRAIEDLMLRARAHRHSYGCSSAARVCPIYPGDTDFTAMAKAVAAHIEAILAVERATVR